MDDFDLYLDADLTIYSYRSTKNSLCMVKDQPKGGGRSYNILYIIYYMTYILFFTKWEKLFFLKRLHWERKLHFRDCILHMPSYLIALKSFWSTANRYESNKLLSIYNKILGKKSCELELRFTAYLTVRRTFTANPHDSLSKIYIFCWKLGLAIS